MQKHTAQPHASSQSKNNQKLERAWEDFWILKIYFSPTKRVLSFRGFNLVLSSVAFYLKLKKFQSSPKFASLN